jgi:hypothetical protein
MNPSSRQASRAETNDPCEHEWVVFSTALAEGWLMLQCIKCLAMATVDDPSEEEWSEAFYAPSTPYRWLDDSRVTIRHETFPIRYVERASAGAN